MADSTIPVNSGQFVDNTELTRTDGTVVNRQRIVLASDTETGVAPPVEQLLGAILNELRFMRSEIGLMRNKLFDLR